MSEIKKLKGKIFEIKKALTNNNKESEGFQIINNKLILEIEIVKEKIVEMANILINKNKELDEDLN